MAPQSASNETPPTSIFNLIHDLHSTINQSIDTSLSWEQLNSPPINYTLVRPIVERFSPKSKDEEKVDEARLQVPKRGDNGESGSRVMGNAMGGVGLGGVLYALMANRIQYINLSAVDMSYAPLQNSRAAFCELLAMKILRTFPNPENEAELVGELVRPWCAFDGAPEDVWIGMGDDRRDVQELRDSALELAIVSTAKHFLSLPLIQHLNNEIYLGQLIYSPSSSRSIISDSYISERTKQRRRNSQSSTTSYPGDSPVKRKRKGKEVSESEVYVYNPYEAGWLDHQRLRVPKWRKWLEFGSFAVLLGLFIATLSGRNLEHVTLIEIVYIVFSWGFILEEFAAAKEHGWTVYAANAWNAFDMAYIGIFLLYLSLRIFALASHSPHTSDLAFDILACGACIIFPRLVFFLIKDNVVILALKAMIARFVSFMALVILAFSGICFCLWTLGRGTWTVKQIIWLMLQIWFGSSYLGFSSSESFHPIFGPIILISYAALCNVLLITILIALLSNIFADINTNAQSEHLFQRVVKTVEGVKSDAVFSYTPPINLLAIVVLVPLSWICSPRTLHRINVFFIRLTNFPILLAISAYERWQYRSKQRSIRLGHAIDRPSLFESFLGNGSESIIASVFESAPPPRSGTGGTTTPPKASSFTPNDESDTDPFPTSNVGSRKGVFDSPLAKLFGKSEAVPAKAGGSVGTVRGKVRKGEEMTESTEDKDLRKEVEGIREGQMRIEEMLGKILSGDKG